MHRLDRPTGGIMVFARTSKSASRLSEQIKNNQMQKIYYAVTTKIPQQKSGNLINYLKKDVKNNIVKILGNGKVEKVECIKTELVKKEEETREVPVNIDGSNYELEMDYVVMAVGSNPEKDVVDSLGLELNKWGYIKVDENHRTSKEKIYAGGDLAGDKGTVAWAARAGRDVAEIISGQKGHSILSKLSSDG